MAKGRFTRRSISTSHWCISESGTKISTRSARPVLSCW
ncbi:hypothetical protein MGSAQ_001535 [marine sediment metagenome]|uniref:Uncharacterized protein n=1 Tax=marine sediment metagenome TaxID=412755 RepID=A0A1B6NU36_9ZZZZ